MDDHHYRIAWIGCPPCSGLEESLKSGNLRLVNFPTVSSYLTSAADHDVAVVWEGRLGDPVGNDAQRLLRVLWQERLPPAPILVLANPTLDVVQRAWRFGWADVIWDAPTHPQLAERILAAARKWWPLGQSLLASRSSAQRERQLTVREWQLCNLLAQGKNLKWIAARWRVSPNTLRNQRYRALQKLQVESDCQLAHLWTTHRWLEQLGRMLRGDTSDPTFTTFCFPHSDGHDLGISPWPFEST